MKVNSKMLSGAAAAEDALARKETRDLADSIPEGHILHDEIERQKALMGGDIEGLPPGHPLYRAMVAAKERYETELEEEETALADKEVASERASIKKAKKLDEKKARRARIVREEEAANMLREAAKAVNSEISSAIEGMRKLYAVISEHEEILNMQPLMKAKTLRLKRFLYATEKGLSTNKMGRA
jgi:hypothetical protein